jgi:hypothetical protein
MLLNSTRTSFMALLLPALLLSGCAPVPRGPFASAHGRYTQPLRDTSDGILVYAVGAREQTGGVLLDFAVEGNRDEALSVAAIVASSAKEHARPGDEEYIHLTDHHKIELREPRDAWPAASLVVGSTRPDTWETVREGDRARFVFSVSVRTRRVEGPLTVWLDLALVHADVERAEPMSRTAMDLDLKTIRADRAKPRDLFVEPAGVEVVPQPREWQMGPDR